MKIAYIAYVPPKRNGVLNKINEQVNYLQKNNNIVKLFLMSQQDILSNNTYILWKKFNYFNPTLGLLLRIIKFNPDCVYMRDDNLLISKLLRLFIFNKKIILEINSNYVFSKNLFKKKYIKQLFLYIAQWVIQNILYKNLKGIITVTNELLEINKKNVQKIICIPNSIALINYNIIKTIQKDDDPNINILFLGSQNQEWHGIDKIIKLGKLLGDSFQLHLVGPSKEDIIKYVPSANVHTYGYLSDYLNIMKKCHICIGTMALHRVLLNEASPLKTREYLARGFPIIIGYLDTAILKLSSLPDFVYMVNNSENSIEQLDIDSLIKFCRNNKNRIVEHHEVEEVIDVNYIEKKRLCFIKSCFNNID